MRKISRDEGIEDEENEQKVRKEWADSHPGWTFLFILLVGVVIVGAITLAPYHDISVKRWMTFIVLSLIGVPIVSWKIVHASKEEKPK